MSKLYRTFLLIVVAGILVSPGRNLFAQNKSVRLEVRPGSAPSASLQVVTGPTRNLALPRSVAGVGDLSLRVTNLRLADFVSGAPVSFRELQPGEYFADKEFSMASYDVSLSPRTQRIAAAHTSWMKDDRGVLMLADLLPASSDGDVNISFAGNQVPIQSIELGTGENKADLHDAENSVFFVGSGWRMRKTDRCRECPTLYISDSWHFTDDEAVSFVADISEAYNKLFRSTELPYVQIAITRFPVPTEPGEWQAETRGRSVIIISSDMPFKSQSLQRLHEQLRHEVFHLWIPNGVNLTGNYDWFYEGFALYQSLRLAVSMNRIRFEDFLDTLSRAHTIDSAGSRRLSLIDASKARFGGSNTQVYARGMLVAFLTDLAMLERSKGKRSIEDMLREFYAKHRKPNAAVDGNAAAMESLKLAAGDAIVSRYVTGTDKIDWTKELALAGISDSDPGPITTLRVSEKLSGRQKTLVDKLGYNNWRKLSPRSK